MRFRYEVPGPRPYLNLDGTIKSKTANPAIFDAVDGDCQPGSCSHNTPCSNMSSLYLPKPWDLAQLARLRAILRRKEAEAAKVALIPSRQSIRRLQRRRARLSSESDSSDTTAQTKASQSPDTGPEYAIASPTPSWSSGNGSACSHIAPSRLGSDPLGGDSGDARTNLESICQLPEPEIKSEVQASHIPSAPRYRGKQGVRNFDLVRRTLHPKARTPDIKSPTLSYPPASIPANPGHSDTDIKFTNSPHKVPQPMFIFYTAHNTSQWSVKKNEGFTSRVKLQIHATNFANAVAQMLDIEPVPKIVDLLTVGKPGWQRKLYEVELPQPDGCGPSTMPRKIEVAHDYIIGIPKRCDSETEGEDATADNRKDYQGNGADGWEYWESWVEVAKLYP
ncbi:hypothetical protein TWF281_002911 [Arthrobotrys megalospora]